MPSELSLTLQISSQIDDGIVRLDPADMRLLNILSREVVALSGARKSYARVLPASMEDRNQRLAIVSPLLSCNIGVQTGHKAEVLAERKAPMLAESLTLQVADDLDRLNLLVRQKLLNGFWYERPVIVGDWLRMPSLDRNPLLAQVAETKPEGLVQVGHSTVYSITTEQENPRLPPLGGLRDIYRTCQFMATERLKSGLNDAARSVLLTGPSGCGKARLVKRLAEELQVPIVILGANQLLDKMLAGVITDLGVSLTELARRGPTIILLDHLEVLSRRENDTAALHAASRAVVSQICALLDEAAMQPGIMIFGVGSGAINFRFRENRRFDVILPVDAPNSLERHEILLVSTRSLPLLDSVNLGKVAAAATGATARDLGQLVSTASHLAQGPRLTDYDFQAAARHVEYSAAGDVRCDIPSMAWNDVAGLDDIKKLLRETLSWSLKFREQFDEAGVKPPRSILLSGGKGTGKTSLVRALANIIPLNFIEIDCSLLGASDAEKAVQVIRDSFILARRKAPCLVFFDDIDVLFDVQDATETGIKASPVIPRLLIELDGLALMPGVMVVAATNRPDRLSVEILTPGRFDYAATLPMPDTAARKKILQIHAHKLPLAADIDFDHLANITHGMSPADIANLCNRVGLLALRQSLSEEHGAIVPPAVSAVLFEQVLRGRKG